MRRWRRKWKKRSRRGKETNPYKILLVEDDAAISEMLKNYLETENYELTCARGGGCHCLLYAGRNRFGDAGEQRDLLCLAVCGGCGVRLAFGLAGGDAVLILLIKFV